MARKDSKKKLMETPVGSSGVNESQGKPWDKSNLNSSPSVPDPLGYTKR